MKAKAEGVFGSKYGEIVKVYSIGDYDKEICGGPHAEHTGQLGEFKIIKEQSSSAGIRRIKAVIDASKAICKISNLIGKVTTKITSTKSGRDTWSFLLVGLSGASRLTTFFLIWVNRIIC